MSMYGGVSAPVSFLPCVEILSLTTYYGKKGGGVY